MKEYALAFYPRLTLATSLRNSWGVQDKPSPFFLGKFPLVRQRNFDREIIRGTSIRGPMTVASAAPEPRPKRVVATAMATSKWLLEPMRTEGAVDP